MQCNPKYSIEIKFKFNVQLIFRFSFNFIAFSIVASTIYDFVTEKFKLKQKKYFTAFSITSNISNLLKINNNTSNINCIDGLKVLSALWIVMGHRKFGKDIKTDIIFERFVFRLIDAYHLGVTTFFVCSGILVTQSFLRALERWILNLCTKILF